MMSDELGRCRHDSISSASQFFHFKSDTLQISVNDLQFSCQRTYHHTAEHVSIKSPSKVHICIFHRISDMLQKSVNDLQYICQCTNHFMEEHVSHKSPYKFHNCVSTSQDISEKGVQPTTGMRAGMALKERIPYLKMHLFLIGYEKTKTVLKNMLLESIFYIIKFLEKQCIHG